ncbi:MAG: helix-turn-helix domain-containing protein [Erysipelotrichaceae bacterium]|nr:helix-turn-helix domain-containing protein [Erysipelotrichaceae bacterium]
MEKLFITVDEVADILDVSKAKAYKVVQDLNNQLQDEGYIIIRGRINRDYFMEHIYKSHKKEV